jgi:hypothetical protein
MAYSASALPTDSSQQASKLMLGLKVGAAAGVANPVQENVRED